MKHIQGIGAVCILSVADGDYQIDVGGRVIPFEFSDRFGPIPLNKNGEISARRPTNKFLNAATLWVEQGKRVGEDGLCIWEEPPDWKEDHIQISARRWVHKDTWKKWLSEPDSKMGKLAAQLIKEKAKATQQVAKRA